MDIHFTVMMIDWDFKNKNVYEFGMNFNSFVHNKKSDMKNEN